MDSNVPEKDYNHILGVLQEGNVSILELVNVLLTDKRIKPQTSPFANLAVCWVLNRSDISELNHMMRSSYSGGKRLRR